ncbi:LOW QUALITY PROTEIN: nuclear pore complex protein Nup133-like [Liolophura sinensis]|uniref:LOW QUALITY PROTEIN: nuclear pore complex protein Nup133-like n=1 Tax=Liolophura sinensis TaxID=3198878 RepID=UPI0031584AD9
MFTPKQGTPSTRITPSSSAVRSSTSNRRSSSMFTPRRRTSGINTRSQALNSSLQTSMIVEKTSQHTVESFGQPLPVLITEALTLADRSTEVSVRLDPSGWAWLVGGRKLFIWRYKASPYARATQCKELTLPPSDLAHNADRVCVIPGVNDSQSVACMAASPEGIVRYWPSVAHETSSTEISAELKGEECASVINFLPYGCILATTTSSLVLVSPCVGQTGLMCRPLKEAQGMFAGISRRMSSFIFGSGPAQTIGAPLHRVLAGDVDEDGVRHFYVLSGSHVQKWVMSEGDVDKLVYQADVERLYREAFAKKCWDQDSAQLTRLKVWLLDMQLTRSGVMVLGAGVNPEVSPAFYYGIGILNIGGLIQPTSLDQFILVDYAERYQEELESQLLGYQLMLTEPYSNTLYMHDQHQVLIVTTTKDSTTSDPVDKVEFKSPGSRILGAGVCDRTALFFSSSYGLVSVKCPQKLEASIMEEPSADVSLRSDVPALNASTAQVQRLSLSNDKSDRLKAAFSLSCSGSIDQAQLIVDELFPPDSPITESNPELDQLVVKLSIALVDDYPASDPRWAEAAVQDSGSSTNSLIILHQLRDKKQRAHNYFINFLKKFSLWNKLWTVHVRDRPMLTRLLLCEHVEKIVAATVLRELHSQHTALVDLAIRRVLVNREDAELVPGLTPQDLFYREVSRVDEVIGALLEYEEETLVTDLLPRDQVNLVMTINTIIEGMIHEALQYRMTSAEMYQSEAGAKGRLPEYCPWTSSLGVKGARTVLHRQFTLTIENAVPEAKDMDTRSGLFQQALALADFILNGYSCQLDSIREQREEGQKERLDQVLRKYEEDRQALLQPFIEYEEYERAASLAEKYYDFPTLIKICETTNKQDRLDRYITQFANRGFSETLFKWYLKEGKRGKLLAMPVRDQSELSEFLKSGNNRYLSWVHDIAANNFSAAHTTLLQLGLEERGSVAKRKTLLSLSKLAALASEPEPEQADDSIELINDEHNFLSHQEDLPLGLIESLGMEPDNMRVLSPLELINLYISDDNEGATEYDFKKALDLLSYVPQSEPDIPVDQVRLHIWCKAVLRDNWSNISTDDPLEGNKHTIFFKTVELAFYEGADLSSYLPQADQLLAAEELGELRHNKNFQFLLRAGYEQIQKVLG